VREGRKIDEARGGGASAHPTAPKFFDFFALAPICMQPEAWRKGTKYGRAEYSAVQCSKAQHSTAQHSTAQHSTAQHSTAQHSTAQHSTAQHSTAQHSTLHYITLHYRTTINVFTGIKRASLLSMSNLITALARKFEIGRE